MSRREKQGPALSDVNEDELENPTYKLVAAEERKEPVRIVENGR